VSSAFTGLRSRLDVPGRLVDVLDHTQATAAHYGRLLAHVRKSGTSRGAHDLIIAAHASETGRLVLTRDAKTRFGDLPGVTSIDT
jgi:predicted nucleic acid-binding protein